MALRSLFVRGGTLTRAIPALLRRQSTSADGHYYTPAMTLTPTWADATDTFQRRHFGDNKEDTAAMCKTIGVKSVDDLINKTVPASIRFKGVNELYFPFAISESELAVQMKQIGSRNIVNRSYLGEGYYSAHLPMVIRRMILENPGWYTQYTPYQAEVSQGRLESLINYQTMICDLTGLDISNASLLDEATAAAEGMAMTFTTHNRKRSVIYVDENTHRSTISVLQGRALPLGIEVVLQDPAKMDFSKQDAFAVLLSYPNTYGEVNDIDSIVERAHKDGTYVICASDLLALTKLRAPGEFGADIVVGNSQRFGVPLGYGGPHAAFLATKLEFSRKLPGRLVGESRDRNGKKSYRLALGTRETHIRRGKATSNICTAQALLANIAAMYAIYHGPEGLKKIANRVHNMTAALADVIVKTGHTVSPVFFDTLKITLNGTTAAEISAAALKQGINIRTIDAKTVGISLDETVTMRDLNDLRDIFTTTAVVWFCRSFDVIKDTKFERKSKFLQHPIFNTNHTEHDMMRYIKSLENKDVSLAHSMIPLGSCTMKLNAATEMQALVWPEFASLHPFVPLNQALTTPLLSL